MPAEWAVLLVEDNPADVYLLQRAFAEVRTGALLMQAHDGDDAIMLMAHRTPDLVLLDLGLPGAGGLEVLASLRLTHTALPIVVMTSSSDEAERRAAFALGADRFITKPTTFEGLLEVIGDLTLRFRPLATQRRTA